jgi:Protein of unknown function (DUF2812).
MRHKVWKLFWDYEKEEKWLNEMSAKGLHMIHYTWAQYIFEEDSQNRYQYRIELLKDRVVNPESVIYIKFLGENDIEHIASYMRWIYLRKDVRNGDFDLYTDKASKIAHYSRVFNVWNTLMIVEGIAGGINLGIGIINLILNERLGNFSYGNISIGISCLVMSVLFWRLGRPLKQKIGKLKRDQIITE